MPRRATETLSLSPGAMTNMVLLACCGICLLPAVAFAALESVRRAREGAVLSMQTRRGALHIGMAAFAAGAFPAARLPATLRASTSDDAELIRLCSCWQAVDRELEALGEARVTIQIEQQTQADVDGILHRRSEIESEIEEHLPPKTKEGAAVIAKVALEAADKWNGNYNLVRDVCNHMAWDALAFFCYLESIKICGACNDWEKSRE